jgi:succinoglycan biosynthesis protein ExoA
MNVSIIVVSFNEEKNISDCLISLINQSYDKNRYEIIVSDGNSRDNTISIVNEFIKNNGNIRLVIEEKKGTSAGRNAGIKTALYDYIAFIDADCAAPDDWLSILVENFKTAKASDERVIAVGGTNMPDTKGGSFIKAIGIALDSFIGSFGSIQGRQLKKLSYVDSLSNLNALYEKKIFIEIGYYDESLLSEAEDADMNYRLYSEGHRFIFVPDSYVWHKMRPTPLSWSRNMFRYGKGRARLLKRYPKMWSAIYTLPLFFLLSWWFVPLTPLHIAFLLPVLYFPVLLLFSLVQSIIKRAPHLFPLVMLVYLTEHFGYAMGEIYGLLNKNVK